MEEHRGCDGFQEDMFWTFSRKSKKITEFFVDQP